MMREESGFGDMRVKSEIGVIGTTFFKFLPFFMGALLVPLIVCWSSTPVLAEGPVSFAPYVQFGVSAEQGYRSVTTGDFNEDGEADLAATRHEGGVLILLGAGNGAFFTAGTCWAGSEPVSVTTGDFNNDGKTDLAVANISSNNVSIFLGAGDGTFGAKVNYAAGTRPESVTTGDFNADGKTDLAVANWGGGVSILLGAGEGTFGAAVNYAAGTRPESVTTGDFNADGKNDLAVANYNGNNISILLGMGDGTFSTAVDFEAGFNPSSVTTGDFNADGKTDLAVANWGGGVAILLGEGDGTFAWTANCDTWGYGPLSVTAGDFNADGKTDLAVASGHIMIFLGAGDGTFSTAVDFEAGFNPYSVITGDFNADGKTDLASANFNPYTGGGIVSILINTTCSPTPNLGLSVHDAFWSSYADFMARELTVQTMFSNNGTETAYGVTMTGAISTNGVTLSTTMPFNMGDIVGGASAEFGVRYHIPVGIGSFRTNVAGSASDACGISHTYPNPWNPISTSN